MLCTNINISLLSCIIGMYLTCVLHKFWNEAVALIHACCVTLLLEGLQFKLFVLLFEFLVTISVARWNNSVVY